MHKPEKHPSLIRVWALASRPHTLTASIAPVIVGSALVSWWETKLKPNDYDIDGLEDDIPLVSLSLLFATFACFIQLGTNLHNDYADFVKGAVGQARATQKGWLTPKQTASGATICLVIASIVGVHLSKITGYNYTGAKRYDLVMILIVTSSVFNAVAYTGGPYPLGYIGLGDISIGYSGLGDLFVFLYFGLVATMTVPYMYTTIKGSNSSLLKISFLVAIPIASLATAIIVVNNLRDRVTDVNAGKNTLAVRFGESFARREYAILVLSSYLILIPMAWIHGVTWLCPIFSFPLAIKELKAVAFGGKDGSALNAHVGGTARVQLIFCLCLAFGIKCS